MGYLYKLLGKIVWLITALASINAGLSALYGINLFTYPFVTANLSYIIEPAYYVIGVSGIISLGMLCWYVVACCGCCHKGKSDCTC